MSSQGERSPGSPHSTNSQMQEVHRQEVMVQSMVETRRTHTIMGEREGNIEVTGSHLSQLSRRQAEWDRQMEFHDQKQEELLSVQWKLVREQTSTMAKELQIAQEDVRKTMAMSRSAMSLVEKYSRENEAKISEERHLRQALSEAVEQRFKKAKEDLEDEAKKRALGDKESPRILALEEQMSIRVKEHRSLEMEVNALSQRLGVALQEIETMKMGLEQEMEERRSADDNFLEQLHSLQVVTLKDHRDSLAQMQDDHVRGYTTIVDQIQVEHKTKWDLLHDKFGTLQRDVRGLEELPTLKGRLGEVEVSIAVQVKEGLKGLERELENRSLLHSKLEKRLQDLVVEGDKDKQAHKQAVDEFEQEMMRLRTRVTSTLQENAAKLQAERAKDKEHLGEQIEIEVRSREETVRSLADKLSGFRTNLDLRLETLENNLRVQESSFRERREAVNLELDAKYTRLEENVDRRLRELLESLQSQLMQEKISREQHDQALEAGLGFFERPFQEIRQVFLHHTGRTRLRKSITTSSKSEITTSSNREIITIRTEERLNVDRADNAERIKHWRRFVTGLLQAAEEEKVCIEDY